MLHFQKFLSMQSEKGQAWLFYNYGTWSCHVKTPDLDGTFLEIKKTANTVEEAIDLAYAQWLRITDKAPELLGRLPAPIADFTVIADDEIPF